MKKWLILFMCLTLMYLSAKSQVFYEDNMVKISGYLSAADSVLFIQIENISDSTLILNEKNINFEKIRNNEWAADLSLLTSGQSLLQPSFGHFMSFKRLLPMQKYTAIAYEFPFPKSLDLFKLFIQVDYLPIPPNLAIVDNILYEQFVELVKKKQLKIQSFTGQLEIIKSEPDRLCKSHLQLK